MTSPTTAAAAVKKRIPEQPVSNIGTAGHVDHGKCLTLDQFVILNGRLFTGREILELAKTRGQLVRVVDGGAIYSLPENSVISIGPDFIPTEARALIYLQRYLGPIYDLKTKTGRSVSVTPEHRLLVNRSGRPLWIKAEDLQVGDHVAIASRISIRGRPEFADWMPIVAKDYDVVSWEDYERLCALTKGFKNFTALSGPDFDKVRLLSRISRRKLAEQVRMSEHRLHQVLTGNAPASPGDVIRLDTFFRGAKIHILGPCEYLLSPKGNGKHSITKLKDAHLDHDLIKWFAFVWTRGTTSRCCIAVTRKVQKRVLKEFLEISKRKFGVQFQRVSSSGYHLNCQAIIDYLRLKYSFRPGNGPESTIASWILALPEDMKATFLRWFFTLKGKFSKTGRIVITQGNERNIVTLGYLLHCFGIVPKLGLVAHRTKRGIRKYHRLLISGRQNLEAFARQVGFEDRNMQAKLEYYLDSISKSRKESDQGTLIDVRSLISLLEKFGLRKEMKWHRAYETLVRTRRISKNKLLDIIQSVERQLSRSQQSMDGLKLSSEHLLNHMKLINFTREQMAEALGLGRERLRRLLRKEDRACLGRMRHLLVRVTKEKIREAELVLRQLKLFANSPLIFDPITSIETRNYDDYIFDLSIPRYANFIGGTVALVCHNTTLVQSITGVWTSAHSEELRRGITIRVGYADAAFYKCESCPAPECYTTQPKCPKCGKEARFLRAVSFVDCPGHESLMANMLSGAALMDGALLVIAANERVPQPQTREHVQALQMLGTERIVVVQNKLDLVSDEEALENYEDIKEFLKQTVAKESPIIPISAQHGINIDALIEAVEEVIVTPKRDTKAAPLMPILRSFDVNRPGTAISELRGGVLGGSLIQGVIRVGDEVEIRPGLYDEIKGRYLPMQTKVMSLGTGAGIVEEVHPGGLVAIGTQLDPFFTKSDALVGHLVGKPGNLPPVYESLSMKTQLFDVAVGDPELRRVDRLKTGEVLRLNVGTAVTVGTVTSIKDEIAEVRIRRPLCTPPGARVAMSRRIGDRWRLIGSGVIE